MAGPWEAFQPPPESHAVNGGQSGPWQSFQPAAEAGPWTKFGGQPTATPTAEQPGVLSNLGRGIGERAAQIAGNVTRFVGTTAEELNDWLDKKRILGKIIVDSDGIRQEFHSDKELAEPQMADVIETARKLENTDLGYTPGTTWEDVKDRPLSNFIPFALEQGIVSSPDMAAVIFALPSYVLGQSAETGQTRAANEGRKEATVLDFVKSMPTAVASAMLERFGAKGILGIDDAVKSLGDVPKAIGKGAAKEAGTEAIQNPLEYAGGVVGTNVPFDPMVAAEQSLAGAVGGGVFGGTVRAATGTGQALLASPDTDAPPSNRTIEEAMAAAEAAAPAPTITAPIDPDLPPPVAPEVALAGAVQEPGKSGEYPGDTTEQNTASIRPSDLPPSTQIVGEAFGPGEAVKKARQASRDWQRAVSARSQGNLEAGKTFEKLANDQLAEAVRLGFKMERKVPPASTETATGTTSELGSAPPTAIPPSAPAAWTATGPTGSAKEISPERSVHVIMRSGKYYGFVLDKGQEPQLLNHAFDTMAEAQQALDLAATGEVKQEGPAAFVFEIVRKTGNKKRPEEAVGNFATIGEARAEVAKLNQAGGTTQYKVQFRKPGTERTIGAYPQGLADTVAATGANAEKLVADNTYLHNNPIKLQFLPAWKAIQEPGMQLHVETGEHPSISPQAAQSIIKFLRPLMKRLTPDLKLIVDINPMSPLTGQGPAHMFGFNGGKIAYIWMRADTINNPVTLLATLAHEYGHAIMGSRFANAGAAVQQALYATYQAQVRKHFQRGNETTAAEFLSDLYSPGNIQSFMSNVSYGTMPTREFFANNAAMNDWYSFDEWMAEQVARWMQSSPRIVSIADRFFKGVADQLKEVLRKTWGILSNVLGIKQDFKPSEAAKLWLEAMLEEKRGRHSEPVSLIGAREAYLRETAENAKTLGLPLAQGVPTQSANYYANLHGRELKIGKKALAQQDRYTSWLKFWPNLLQLAWKNPHIVGLQRYVEVIRQWQIDKMAMISRADTRVKEWRKLTKQMSQNLSNFLFDLERMPYLQKGQNARWPTLQELIALGKQHGLNNDAIRVYQGIKSDFLNALDKIEAAWIKDAQRTFTDPAMLARETFRIQTEMNQLRSKPYFPHERFGDWTVTVWDAKNKIVHFEQVATAREANRLAAKMAKLPQFAGHRVGAGKLAEEVKIFRGLPPSLIKQMAMKVPNLTQAQKMAIDQIAYDMSPAQSFAHHFQRRKGTPGFSTEGMRSYANYFLHAGSHIARLTWRVDMEDAIKDVANSSRTMVGSHTAEAVGKRQGIADWLQRHFDYIMNPQNEWTALRTFAFTWHLAFNISSALVNLTQVPMVAYPYLAARFGDVSSVLQLKKAALDLHKMYSLKGLPQDEIDAIAKGIEQGFLDESQSADLAGAAQHGVLGRIVPGSAVERFRQNFAYWGSFLFQAAEKVNRRVVFRAAYRLAKAQPNSKYVQDIVASNTLLYQELLAKGWSPTNAGAFLAGRDAIDRSMFNYSAYARPEFIRGKKGVLFAFYMFKQNMLYFFKNDPGAARALVIMFMTSGLMGLPFASDISELARFFARSLFGKDFDVEREAREMIIELAGEGGLNDGSSRRVAEMFMHGMGKESMGLTWAGEGLGIPIPGIDLSGRLGMGSMVPGLSPMIAGAEGRIKPDEAIGRTFQEVVGASYGVPLTILRAVESGNLDEFKTVERLLPAAARNLVRAVRYFQEGETTRTGAQIADFDITDTKQAAELALQGLGFAPTSVTRQWDKAAMTREAVQYWGVQRRLLFEQFDKARRSKDREALADAKEAVRRYNRDVPDRRLRVGAQDLLQSSRTREKNRAKIEAGRATQSTYQGLTSQTNSLFPGSPQ